MVTREQLHDLVWSAPMTKVSEQFGVPATYLARVCSALNVPRPPTGYWAKLAVGKAPATEPLPAALPGTQLAWNEKGGPLPAAAGPSRPTAPRRRRSASRATVPATDVHPIVRSTRAEFFRSRPVEHGGYLKPYKKLLPDVSASAAQIDRALGLAGMLYNELEALGANVAIAPGDQRWHGKSVDAREVPQKERQYSYHSSSAWSPMRPTVAFFDEAAIAIAVVEMSAEIMLRYIGDGYIRETEYQANIRRYRYQHTFTTTAELPIGRIRVVFPFQVGVDPYNGTDAPPTLSRMRGQLEQHLDDLRAVLVEAGVSGPYIFQMTFSNLDGQKALKLFFPSGCDEVRVRGMGIVDDIEAPLHANMAYEAIDRASGNLGG